MNRALRVGEFMVMIHDEDRRCEKDVLFKNNPILAGYRRPAANFATGA
jgi:hypothetical protein